ncbi:MAG TPA: sensor histidine kinase [Anaerolineales bacterium]|jgi:signal transduction histidine kinase
MKKFMLEIGRSFYFQVVFGVAVPVFVALALLSALHYSRERDVVMEKIEEMAALSGGQLVRGLNHGMMHNSSKMLTSIIADMTSTGGVVDRIQIINQDSITKYDSANLAINRQNSKSEPGCRECHQDIATRKFTNTLYNVKTGSLRISIPIENKPECSQCHNPAPRYLGVVVMDTALTSLREQLRSELWTDAIFSLVVTAFITVLVYWMLRILVVKRVQVWRSNLLDYASGDFSNRIPVGRDEAGSLSATINYLAEQLERHEKERNERENVRERAIAEERDRISRELHDGLAQLLGYVSTKASAVRVFLQNGKVEQAENNLTQLEEAAQSLAADAREAILGLRTNGQVGDDFSTLVYEYLRQFGRLSGLNINIRADLDALHLPLEAQLQVLRIIQEALSNVRKHSQAKEVTIRLEEQDPRQVLVIEDNGVGFDLAALMIDNQIRFGLFTMRERALSIGADLEVDTAIGKGTRVVIKLPLERN